MAINLWIVKHGKTEENKNGIVQGNEVGTLSKEGYLELEKLGKRLNCLNGKYKFEHIISSDIMRCKETVYEILKYLPPSFKDKIEYTSLIREKNNGDFVGKEHTKFSWDDLNGSFETRKAPNGENLIEVKERGIKFLKQIENKYQNFLNKDSAEDVNILVISHGAFLKILLGNILGMNIYDSIFKLVVENSSLTKVEISEKNKEKYKLVFISDTSHLEN